VRRGALCFLLGLAGCAGRGRDPERLGDQAWHEGRWKDAVNAYLEAGDNPRVVAKLADAAFQAGLYQQAAQSWTRVGTDAPDLAGEAGAELSRIALAAERANDQDALATAILGLRTVVPGWPVGRLALRLVGSGGLPAADAAVILPAALAAAPGRSTADPLLLAMGEAGRMRGSCAEAVPALEGVLRRSVNPAVRDSATVSLGGCELRLGLNALGGGRPGEAERWLDRASRRDPNGVVGRRALVAFGDARWRQGDVMSATFAWQTVASAPVSPDSITTLALTRLQDPSTAGTSADSVSRPGNQ
jgi:hypothetical protein